MSEERTFGLAPHRWMIRAIFGYLNVRNIVAALYLSFLDHGFWLAGQLFRYDQLVDEKFEEENHRASRMLLQYRHLISL